MFKHALSVRSDHSIGESILQIVPMVERAHALGYKSLALTDTMSVSGLPNFSSACKKHDITPILGCVLRVYDDATYRKPAKKSGEAEKINRTYNLKVYVKSETGLRSLMQLLSKANSVEQFYYNARTDLTQVMRLEDVIITTGDLFNVFHHPEAKGIVEQLSQTHPTYVEITPIQSLLFDTLNKKALEVAKSLGVPLLASYPRFYGSPEDASTHDVLRAITSAGEFTMETPWLPIPATRDWCFDEPKGLLERMMATARRIGMDMEQIKASIKAMGEVVDASHYRFEKMPVSLPDMSADPFRTLIDECKLGWVKRFNAEILGHKPNPVDFPIYKERLAYELGILGRLGFSNYFLLVQSIVRWSKENDINVGPGRGSAAGSLVSYLLGITDLDPIRFSLMFERFINPDRLDLPDVDLDFMSSRREEVVQYIVGRFGEDRVAGISNYSTLGPASALRDTARVHALKPYEYTCSKQMEKEHGVSVGLAESGDNVPDIAKFKGEHPVIWGHALKLEGNMRNLGKHAAGVIVASEPIATRAVVMKRTEDALPVVNWDKTMVEDFGLIKMDILGLSTLDVLDHATQYIWERHKRKIDLLSLPLDDRQVLDAFGKGDTIGVFQFSGSGMRKLLKDLAVLEPLAFEEVAATTALFRPGPIDAGLMDKYVAIKQGKQLPSYIHPLVEPALRDTFGVMVYQEQIMAVCRDLASFTGAEADSVRKAMGKKDHDKMAEYGEKFIAGAQDAGLNETEAMMLWEEMALFAGYAFNRSHSAAYTLLSYQTMWLKVHYPAEFYAASLTVVDADDKLSPIILDAKAHGIEIMPPDINKSTDRIEIEGENVLYAPFQAIKGISANVAAKVLEVRAATARPFESFSDFEAQVKATVGGKINVRHKTSLQRVGAFAVVDGEKPATHPDRLKDRLELMPGFTTDAVKAERGINSDRLTKLQIIELVSEIRVCDGCTLAGADHPSPTMGKKPKFMMVFDSPNWKEAQAGKILAGDIGDVIKAALKEAGISADDGYFTTVVKAVKPKEQKVLSTEQINGCSKFLAKEIEILKPAVIVAMGGNAIRYFSPGTKGNPAEITGKTIFDPGLDASIIFGINPNTIFFDASKIKLLQATCAQIAELIT